MIVHRTEQGSDEWHRLRAGLATASMFKVARSKVDGLTEQQALYVQAKRKGFDDQTARDSAGYKTKPTMSEKLERALAGLPVGDFSDPAKNYAFRLAVERISGMPMDEQFETYAMRRGRELEPEARKEHEHQSGLIIYQAGFVTDDSGRFGCSADGLIGHDAGAEYKCLMSPEGVRTVILDHDLAAFKDQVMGSMWVTGLARWHYCMYCPALRVVNRQLYWRTIDRDEKYIADLERDMLEFYELSRGYEQKLRTDPIAAGQPLVLAS